jgi:cell fate regulator YaaT (PSP1 superfamily)
MNQTAEKVIGIRFQRVGKIYHFQASAGVDFLIGDFVVVDTARGRQLGEIVQVLKNPAPPPEGYWKPILRKATARDLVLRQTWQKKEIEATINCRARLAELKIPGVKIVNSEFSFDGSRLYFFYSTESEARIDLKKLRNAMQQLYPTSKVEMHQMGPRDAAKILGGMGACGLEKRCCSMFITDFSPISIKMAKEQGISLSPSEITGMCGRLRCCLVYEYEHYVEARKVLPKKNKRVVTPSGEGKVVDVFPLKNSVMVALDSGSQAEFDACDLQPWDELEALRRKSQAPCDRHESGGCSCGKDAKVSETEDKLSGSSSQEADRTKPDTTGRTHQRSRKAKFSSQRAASKKRSQTKKPSNTSN